MKHVCGNRELWASRMLVAKYLDDEENYAQVVREIAGCAMCWETLAHWVVALLAGGRVLAAGGRDKAADYELEALDRLFTITNKPF